MKLNYDCIRDILLTVESLDRIDSSVYLDDYKKYKLLEKYSNDEIQYHSIKLIQEEYVQGLKVSGSDITNAIFMEDLTWKGHELLNDIRSESVFKETKTKVINSIGTVSLSIFQQLAVDIAMKTLGLK
ncbi:hypothetical protein BI362_02925 [Streptococcus parauberis]|uniref:DUF2513 domain-containing protein n=1 Tax=Streptococcus parauberis TaxID=1348 RepID=UPI00030B62D1|nr:DUF2513 domain-containing protein [Streptococcus parauberis]QBX17898.1 hypothetical protein Javan383_0053 [Streptococcus phage Javan383]QBX18238.1 hypothetical protein Javan407_0005 [Streptococcus phage Javan407]QBX27395.1 hypothetical protein Javan384_0060 [Streptococcus phage Javan384]OHY31284.1 hypothetical protein BI362_02925 [Streptococcus parauberis]UWM90225.1 DUF2513 domain-containing protein [Streptococcus parauberis]